MVCNVHRTILFHINLINLILNVNLTHSNKSSEIIILRIKKVNKSNCPTSHLIRVRYLFHIKVPHDYTPLRVKNLCLMILNAVQHWLSNQICDFIFSVIY